MRARRSQVVGWLAVLMYAALLVVVVWQAWARDDLDRSAPPRREAGAPQFIEAWERSRTATFVTTGTYERHNVQTGASIASEDIVVQRPPRRLHRQLGGVDGRDDDRLVVCPAPPEGDEHEEPCRLGPSGGPTYAASLRDEIAGLRSILLGDDPLYRVREREPGCFALELLRIDPRAPFGVQASFCFDPATGAPTSRRVVHEGGTTEVLVVTDIRTEVTDADLEP
jgi:hypothetical protein